MHVDLYNFAGAVSLECLKLAEISSVFQQMSDKTMPESVQE